MQTIVNKTQVYLAGGLPSDPASSGRATLDETVLIVDDDLGFVFWLGKALDNAGYYALPAKNVSDARTLIEQLNLEVDLLIIDPSLDGAGGFTDHLRSFHKQLKVIALTDEQEEPGAGFFQSDATQPRFLKERGALAREWLGTIQHVLATRALKVGRQGGTI